MNNFYQQGNIGGGMGHMNQMNVGMSHMNNMGNMGNMGGGMNMGMGGGMNNMNQGSGGNNYMGNMGNIGSGLNNLNPAMSVQGNIGAGMKNMNFNGTNMGNTGGNMNLNMTHGINSQSNMSNMSSMSTISGTGGMPGYKHTNEAKSERLNLKMTQDERRTYGNLFMMADPKGTNKLEGKEAVEFLKKSGLDKETLRKVWLIAAQTDSGYLLKDEFYIALRLIALAQNNMEVSEESIRINHPLPPPPKFDFKSQEQERVNNQHANIFEIEKKQDVNANANININTNMNPQHRQVDPSNDTEGLLDDSKWVISEEDTTKFQKLFNSTKDFGEKLSLRMLHLMCSNAKVNPTVLNKILSIMPQVPDNLLSFKHFRVIFQLISKSHLKIEIPSSLPRYLRNQLEDNPAPSKLQPNLIQQQQPQQPQPIQQTNIPKAKNTNVEFDFDCGLAPLKPKPKLEEKSIDKVSDQEQIKPKGNFQDELLPPMPKDSKYFQSKIQNENLKSELMKIQKTMLIVLNENENENAFLMKVLEEDNKLLYSLMDEVEKINTSLNKLTQRNQQINNAALNFRRKINIEKDDIAAKALYSQQMGRGIGANHGQNQGQNYGNQGVVNTQAGGVNQGVFGGNPFEEHSPKQQEKISFQSPNTRQVGHQMQEQGGFGFQEIQAQGDQSQGYSQFQQGHTNTNSLHSNPNPTGNFSLFTNANTYPGKDNFEVPKQQVSNNQGGSFHNQNFPNLNNQQGATGGSFHGSHHSKNNSINNLQGTVNTQVNNPKSSFNNIGFEMDFPAVPPNNTGTNQSSPNQFRASIGDNPYPRISEINDGRLHGENTNTFHPAFESNMHFNANINVQENKQANANISANAHKDDFDFDFNMDSFKDIKQSKGNDFFANDGWDDFK